jgi:hypothetical protein
MHSRMHKPEYLHFLDLRDVACCLCLEFLAGVWMFLGLFGHSCGASGQLLSYTSTVTDCSQWHTQYARTDYTAGCSAAVCQYTHHSCTSSCSHHPVQSSACGHRASCWGECTDNSVVKCGSCFQWVVPAATVAAVSNSDSVCGGRIDMLAS